MPKSKTEKNTVDFEASLTELSTLVEAMEKGGITLEESLKKFERGILLVRTCQNALKQAEQKIQILTHQNGATELAPFESEIQQ